jgi:hypothetical protein
VGTSGPRWIPGQRAISTNVTDEFGVRQVARYDIDSGRSTLLTTGSEVKVDPFLFEAPEHPGELLICCILDDREVAFYRRRGRDWNIVNRFAPPGAINPLSRTLVTSAEPFVHRGRSYAVYAVTYPDGVSRICIASLDGTVNAWVSRQGPLRQVDPEAVPIGDRLFVYYWTAADELGINRLHCCDVRLLP